MVKLLSTETARRQANFQPNLWGDTFLNLTLPDEVTETQSKKEVEKLKEQVRKELVANDKDFKAKLVYINDIQRLGVAYHFEDETQANLLNIFKNMEESNQDCYKNDLHYVSLRFRIFRQHGFRVSCDVFDAFKNEEGRVKDSFSSVEGMLSMYEALHVRVKGEGALDDALADITTRLASLATDPNCNMSRQIAHALKLPLFKRTTRLDSTYQISFYESDLLCNQTLLQLAKLDFNLLQVFHRNELRDIIRWSESLCLSTKLSFARDRLVEAYFWILGVYYEPKYSRARIYLNKLFKIISITDDMYDAYGTVEEVQLFTDAIQRWDRSCASNLPEYMKFFYNVILDTFEEFEKDLAEEGRAYAVDYVRQELKASCETYMIEAKWCHEGYVPTFEEYMENGIITAGYYYVIAATYLGMRDVANKDCFEWIRASKAVKASSVLARAVNDIGTHKFERNRGHVASAIQCYIKQYGGTPAEGYKQLGLIVEEAWKDIIEDMLPPIAVPMPIFTRVLDLSRVLHDVYGIDEDGYTMNHLLKPKVEATLLTTYNITM